VGYTKYTVTKGGEKMLGLLLLGALLAD